MSFSKAVEAAFYEAITHNISSSFRMEKHSHLGLMRG